ncbi:hypothetical protein GOP47_0029433 [Adiantum capillus-veneris]|nr:hypothetical protein GOP47_0029433 [Adiantum capillus-veneris]
MPLTNSFIRRILHGLPAFSTWRNQRRIPAYKVDIAIKIASRCFIRMRPFTLLRHHKAVN